MNIRTVAFATLMSVISLVTTASAHGDETHQDPTPWYATDTFLIGLTVIIGLGVLLIAVAYYYHSTEDIDATTNE